jgi:hypothetical protein
VIVVMTVTVAGLVTALVGVVVVLAALAVHDTQHARENTLPHIDMYEERAPANGPQRRRSHADARPGRAKSVILRFAQEHGFQEGRRS